MRIAVAVWTACTIVLGAAVAGADTVELKNGDKLEGVILEQDDDKTVLEHPLLGRIVIPANDIKEPEEDKEKPGLFGTRILAGWTRGISAGIGGASGKSKEFSMNADLGLSRETERNRMRYVARFVRARSSNETTDNAFDTRYVHDFLFPPSSWFPFAAASYRLDSQQDWLHRLGAQGGVGYEFIKNDTWEVIGRAGGGISQTLGDERAHAPPDGDPNTRPAKIGDDPVRTEPNGLAALELTWNYYEGQSLSAATLYLPDLSDTPEYRSESRAEWKIAAGFVQGLAFKFGTSFIYDSHELDKKKRDFRYYANLAYDF
jgi:hypothetical protein